MRTFAIGAVAASLAFGAGAASAQQQFVSIGTGGITGVYYPAGGAICRMVNKDRKEHGIRCSAESTGGSVYNVDALQAGELEFGVAQSDVQFNAHTGKEQWNGKPFEGLRSVFAVHAEPVTIVARKDAGIRNITDLKGTRVNIGNPGSGTYATWEVIESALGWQRSDLAMAGDLKSAETRQALCDNQIDAYYWLVGHPSALTQETLMSCDSNLVNAQAPEIDRLVEENPYYRKATIPAGTYSGQDEDIDTFGVGATFVTSADVPEEVVYIVVKAVFDNIDEFRSLHPAFANLKEEEMITESLSAPLHPGAVKYYKERGWM